MRRRSVSRIGGGSGGSGAATVYVTTTGNDSTGERGKSSKPFLTVAAAITVAQPGDTVSIGAGTFASPGTVTKDLLRFVGAGQPDFDDPDTPTALTGGTILQGLFSLQCDGASVTDLGVDCGSAFLGGDTATDVFLFGGTNSSDLHTGFMATRVSALAKARDSAVHAMKAEWGSNATFVDCKTMYGFYGLVLKCANGSSSGLIAAHHSAAGVVLKSDTDQINTTMTVTNTVVSDVGDGVIIYANGGTLSGLTIDDLTITDGGVGIRDNQSTSSLGGTLTIRNVTATLDTGDGLGIDLVNTDCASVVIEDCTLDGTGSGGTAGVRVGTAVDMCVIQRHTQTNFGTWSILNYGPNTRFVESVSIPSGGNIFNNDAGGAFLYNVSSALSGGRGVTGTITSA